MSRILAIAHHIAVFALTAYVIVPSIHGSLAHNHARPDGPNEVVHSAPAHAQGATGSSTCPICRIGGNRRTLVPLRTTGAQREIPRASRLVRPSAEGHPTSVKLTPSAPRAPPVSI